MLEIIILLRLTKRIGWLAREKKQNEGRWKLYVILAWFGAEFIGGAVGYILFGELAASMVIGIGCAIPTYFIVKAKLNKIPNEEWLQQIGVPEETDVQTN